jgi:carboxylate-amine ligase
LVADKQVKCGGAGTHQNGKTTHYWRSRYHTIVNELQDAARSNLIFGMHCHVE